MLSKEIMKYSLKNLLERKTRSFLTVLSIFIGIAAIFIFISFGIGLYNYVNQLSGESGANKFVVQNKGIGAPGADPTFKLSIDDLKAVERVKGVDYALPIYFKVVEVSKKGIKKYVFASGYPVSSRSNKVLSEFFNFDIEKGRNLKKGDKGKVVLGYNYMVEGKIFPHGLEVGEKIEINGKKFEIVGFYESVGNPQDDSNVYMSIDDLRNLFGEQEEKYSLILGVVSNQDELHDIVERVEKEIRKARNQEEGKEDFYVETYEELIEKFSNILNIVVGFVILIAFISVIVSTVNTANTMATSVLERTQEIGILKSIGARRSAIMSIFLFESGFIGFLAGLLGVAFGFILSYIAGRILTNLGWGFLSPAFPWYLFVSLVIFSTLVGLLSGVTVAYQASRLDPVEALRWE